MGRHNRRSNEYPNAYVFHVETTRSAQRIGRWVPEIWLGPWCVWRGLGPGTEQPDELAALAFARTELVTHLSVLLDG